MLNQLFYWDNLEVLRRYIKDKTDDIATQGLAEIQDNYLGHGTSQRIDLLSDLARVLGKGSLLVYLV
ncbi:hypothetical protein [Pseudanabaena sp. Chao 1811]|uniref:hypothetical protein n=1 Tax=Pseudanabaena sp. Chao 1811 TaxID=2963092 RepID=UPI0022F39B4F|nr:hypothetical protein [Pseudanabaena sp. Chao 1811]